MVKTIKYKTKADCGACRNAQNYGVAAQFYGTGKNADGRPWRGYVCDGHANVMVEDGAQITLRKLRN